MNEFGKKIHPKNVNQQLFVVAKVEFGVIKVKLKNFHGCRTSMVESG
jgi:hypothetical protein